MTRRRGAVFAAAVAVLLAALAAGLYRALPPPSLARSRLLSTLVLARDGSVLRGFLSADGKWRLPVRPEAVDPLYRRMLIATEDRRFAEHPGIDPIAALRALGQLVRSGHIVSGASTLTMQVVRLLEKRPRTLRSKLVEMGEALALERRLGRERVLGLYLTLAPFGGNLEGVRAASLAYFGKEPAHLSAAEAALLVALPRAPESLRPDRHWAAAEAARDRVLARLARAGAIAPALAAEARAERVPRRRRAMPFHAPHLAEALHVADGTAARIGTTIDPLLQREVEALLARAVGARDAAAPGERGTFAAIVVDNATRQVLAYVGNADFFSGARHGTLDMAAAVRSPGSALKPFIYAMAFDRLILHPETLLDDRPRDFGGYAPGDFDGSFAGEVSAREALQRSLNVPAVAVLDRLGPLRFTAALASAGIRLHLPGPASRPGLAVALGGDGITLRDLVTLYAALSEGGRVAPLRFRAADPASAGTAIFGPLAAFYVDDILTGTPPPPGVLPAELRRGRPLAFKTGTSYGYRDAWAVGYDRATTIGVWAGRPDGTPMPGRSGLMTAAPVLFEIADLLGPSPADSEPGPPPPGALMVSRDELPARLQSLAPGPRERAASGEGAGEGIKGPRIVYPPDGALVDWRGEEVPLEATGGRGQLRWLVDGKPLAPSSSSGAAHPALYWRPDGLGFCTLTVIDAAGASARSTVRLVP